MDTCAAWLPVTKCTSVPCEHPVTTRHPEMPRTIRTFSVIVGPFCPAWVRRGFGVAAPVEVSRWCAEPRWAGGRRSLRYEMLKLTLNGWTHGRLVMEGHQPAALRVAAPARDASNVTTASPVGVVRCFPVGVRICGAELAGFLCVANISTVVPTAISIGASPL